jgi:type VI secretion system ImpM family protein
MPTDTVTAVPGFDVSLFGKLPARPDFVRVNYGGRAAAELDQWLVQNVEQLHLGKVPLPGPLRFAFCSPRTQHVMFGALAPSRDEAGREFPVTVFDSVPLAAVLGRLPLQLLAHEAFFNGAEAVIREAQTLAAGAPIEPSLSGLHAPAVAAAAAHESDYQRTLVGASAPKFLERAFGPIDSGMCFYGCFAFLTAAAPVRDEAPEKLGTVLECPVGSELDRMAWITLAGRVLSRWRSAVPSCFWIERPSPRLLIALGPPPSDILRALADSAYKSSRIWPLTTDRPQAVERAKTALGPSLPQARPPAADPADDASLDELLEVLSSIRPA